MAPRYFFAGGFFAPAAAATTVTRLGGFFFTGGFFAPAAAATTVTRLRLGLGWSDCWAFRRCRWLFRRLRTHKLPDWSTTRWLGLGWSGCWAFRRCRWLFRRLRTHTLPDWSTARGGGRCHVDGKRRVQNECGRLDVGFFGHTHPRLPWHFLRGHLGGIRACRATLSLGFSSLLQREPPAVSRYYGGAVGATM